MPAARADPAPSALRITDDWHAPLGGVLICAAGAFALVGFPLDDVWHRLFGQDVTLWGPTHLMLIGGAAMTLIGLAVLQVEGGRAKGISRAATQRARLAVHLRRVSLAGGLLIGLSTFQAEFDFGVPQFRMVFQPVLIMLAAAVGAGRDAHVARAAAAALGAVAFFLAIRGAMALLVGPVLGESIAALPALHRRGAAGRGGRPCAFRPPSARCASLSSSGAAIGTVGLAAEWAWSHVWMPDPVAARAVPRGCAARRSRWRSAAPWWAAGSDPAWPPTSVPRMPSMRVAAVTGAAVLAAVVGYSLSPCPSRASGQT